MPASFATTTHLLSFRTAVLAALLGVSVLLPSGCGPAASNSPKGQPISPELLKFQGLKGKIDIAGGTAHIPVMNEAVKRINAANPDIRITVAGGGSGVGIKKLGERLVEIGNSGRAVTDKEREAYGLTSYPFAVDGVAVIVHPSNPVTALSADQTRKIYAGEIANWKEVGGPDGAIHLVTRDEASGTRETFWEILLGKGAIAASAIVVNSSGAIRLAVAQDPLAIGYNSIGHLDNTVKSVTIDSQAPTQENAASGNYRVIRKLYMNTRGKPSELVQTFIDYIRSPEGDGLVRDAGFIPVKE